MEAVVGWHVRSAGSSFPQESVLDSRSPLTFRTCLTTKRAELLALFVVEEHHGSRNAATIARANQPFASLPPTTTMAPKRAPPKLPASAFQHSAPEARRTHAKSLIDAHVHLFSVAQLANGNVSWPLEQHPDGVLGQPHDLAFYGAVTALGIEQMGGATSFDGFVFVQAEVRAGAALLDLLPPFG